jgi:predicted small lipoprotein YifL
MIFKSLLVLTFLSSLSRVNSLMCYNCGYLELPNGDKVAVTEEFGKIPFCDDFTTNEENTVEAYAVSLHLIFIRFIIILILKSYSV